MGGIPSWAVVGAKVVLVDDEPTVHNPVSPPLTLNSIYTIASIETGDWCVLCRIKEDGCFGRFGLFRFRPVTPFSLEDDIELFRPLLSPSLDELAAACDAQLAELDATLERLATS